MSETQERTPGPWIVNGDKFQVEYWPTNFIPDHRVVALCATGDGAMANAQYIVKCCNGYPKAIEALKKLRVAATLLAENSRFCVVNHHPLDAEHPGLPPWLNDCVLDIEEARSVLTELGEDQ